MEDPEENTVITDLEKFRQIGINAYSHYLEKEGKLFLHGYIQSFVKQYALGYIWQMDIQIDQIPKIQREALSYLSGIGEAARGNRDKEILEHIGKCLINKN